MTTNLKNQQKIFHNDQGKEIRCAYFSDM